MKRQAENLKRNRQRSGSVLVVFALTMTVLVGLAALTLDVGRLMIAKQRAQMVCDAAVLAGAHYLTGEQSSTTVNSAVGLPTALDGDAARAAKYAALGNNEANTSWPTLTADGSQPGITITFPPSPASAGTVTANDGTVIPVKPGEAIRARAAVRVPMIFAGIFGITSSDVHAESTAIVGVQTQVPTPVTVTANPFPWAVADSRIWDKSTNPPTPRLAMGSQVVMKITTHTDPAGFIGNGNFLAVAFEGDTGGDDYRDRIESTTNVTFNLSQEIELETEPGNMVGPTEQGLLVRLSSDVYPYPSMNNTSWQTWLNSYNPVTGERTDTRRVGIIPIVQDPESSLNGRKSLTLVGFAGVFVEGFQNIVEGGQEYVSLVARFTGGIYTANGITWLDPGTIPPFSTTVTSVRLIK